MALKTRGEILSLIENNINDNTESQITPAKLRAVLEALADGYGRQIFGLNKHAELTSAWEGKLVYVNAQLEAEAYALTGYSAGSEGVAGSWAIQSNAVPGGSGQITIRAGGVVASYSRGQFNSVSSPNGTSPSTNYEVLENLEHYMNTILEVGHVVVVLDEPSQRLLISEAEPSTTVEKGISTSDWNTTITELVEPEDPVDETSGSGDQPVAGILLAIIENTAIVDFGPVCLLQAETSIQSGEVVFPGPTGGVRSDQGGEAFSVGIALHDADAEANVLVRIDSVS